MTETQEASLSLEHLRAELERIDVLVRRQVLRWARDGEDPSEAFRGLHVSDAKARKLSGRRAPSGAASVGEAPASGDEDAALAARYIEAGQASRALADEAHGRGALTRLEYLAGAFGLDAFELDTLLICLAPALDLRYERLFAYLQDDVTRKRASVNLVLDLLCGDDPARRMSALLRFGDDATLFKNALLSRIPDAGAAPQPILSQGMAVDESVVVWLLGGYQPAADLAGHAELTWPEQLGSDELAVAGIRADLDQGIAMETPVVSLLGSDQSGQAAAARYLAAGFQRPLLTVDLPAVTASGVLPARAVSMALRDSLLTSAAPYLAGWEVVAGAGEQGSPAALAKVCDFPGPVILGSRAAWLPSGLDRQRVFLRVQVAIPDFDHRAALWRHHLGDPGDGDGLDASPLAGQFLLTAGQIRDAVASARDAAAQAGRAVNQADLFSAARTHSSPGLSGLARKITPRYTWADIVLPGDQAAILHEIVATVRGRPMVLEQWGVGRKLSSSGGVTILFAGPPGTGKTMGAEVIASELGLDLYKIDLSTIVSKYIGETEKNLERIFGEAQSSNAILFFDEADAIFGKRSEVKDAHDRYANIEISYLLQRMEAYDGVTILATNLRANLDEAFTRRLQFAVDFPFPEEEYRRRIWQTLFPPGVPRADDLDFDLLARRFKLAGGNIRNIIVSAAYLAASDGGQVTMSHLLHGTRREMQKMGRLINEGELTPR